MRAAVFPLIEEEYHRTVEAVLRISGGTALAERFPRFRRKLARRLPIAQPDLPPADRAAAPVPGERQRQVAGGAALGAAAVDQLHRGGVRGDGVGAETRESPSAQ